jgi:hypothetical protein
VRLRRFAAVVMPDVSATATKARRSDVSMFLAICASIIGGYSTHNEHSFY